MIDKLLIKDSKGEKSVTMTAFVLGFVIVNAKLVLSGFKIAGFTMAAFTGGEYAAAVGALGAIYVLRRNTGEPQPKTILKKEPTIRLSDKYKGLEDKSTPRKRTRTARRPRGKTKKRTS